MPLGLTDNEDQAIALLEQIATGIGQLSGSSEQVDINRMGLPLRSISPRSYIVRETDDLDAAKDNGTVKLSPGETVELVAHEPQTAAALVTAIGANDEQDVVYWIEVDNTYTVGGQTNSPLGTINDPFSFVATLGGAIPVESYVAYKAGMPSTASGPVDMAGRLHVEEVR